MKGLVEKPHFDESVFKPGTPVVVTIRKDPASSYRLFSEFCLVNRVNKDTMEVTYVDSESGNNKGRILKACDVQEGTTKIRFMKSVDDDESEFKVLCGSYLIYGPQGIGKTTLGNMLRECGCEVCEYINAPRDEKNLEKGTVIIQMRRPKGENN